MVTEEKIKKTKELNTIGRDLQGVRDVQDLYGKMLASNYQSLMIVNRDFLDQAKKAIDNLTNRLTELNNEDGERQFFLIVNDVSDSNKPFGMDIKTKDQVIDAFKSIIPFLDNAKQQEFLAKETELAEI